MLATSTDERAPYRGAELHGRPRVPDRRLPGDRPARQPSTARSCSTPSASALSALSWRDGQDTGGWPWDLQSTMPNVEDNELFYPILYLWRKELPELGRGGHVPRRQRRRAGDRAAQDRRDEPLHDHERARRPRAGALRRLLELDEQVRALQGRQRAGAARAHGPDADRASRSSKASSTGCRRSRSTARRRPTTCSSARGRPPPATATRSTASPGASRDDVAAGRVTADWGAQAYGVVLDGGGAVDDAATEARRAALRQERLAEAKPWSGEEST